MHIDRQDKSNYTNRSHVGSSSAASLYSWKFWVLEFRPWINRTWQLYILPLIAWLFKARGRWAKLRRRPCAMKVKTMESLCGTAVKASSSLSLCDVVSFCISALCHAGGRADWHRCRRGLCFCILMHATERSAHMHKKEEFAISDAPRVVMTSLRSHLCCKFNSSRDYGAQHI